MRSHNMIFFGKMLLLLLGYIGLTAAPCAAHKIKIFASVEGTTISGYAYSSGGERIRNQMVILESTEGAKLAETMTGEQGEFSFTATCRCDYVVVLELTDGHRATFLVSAEEFPESLPAPPAESPNAETTPPVAETSSVRQTAEEVAKDLSSEELETIVEAVVSRHIRPLREQLETYENTTRLHDTLGGIGYILGISGVVFFMLGKRKDRNT